MQDKTKLAQQDPRISYQYAPSSAGERCSLCNMFRPAASCTDVSGVIDRNGWCKIFAPKLGVQRHT